MLKASISRRLLFMVERIIVGPLHTNAYIYSISKKECIVIDPGADPELLCQKLDAINMKPKSIIFTHGYLDHISAACSLIQAYIEFSEEIPVGIHVDDQHLIGNEGLALQCALFTQTGNSDLYEELKADLPTADFTYSEGDFIPESNLKVIHTPGRSKGSVCFYEESQNILFTGDTLLFKAVGNTNLPESNLELLLQSVKEQLFTLPPETVVFPGHGPRTTIERELRNNPVFRNPD